MAEESRVRHMGILHKGLLHHGDLLPLCEKHFHDHDETWLVLGGRAQTYWIDYDGQREEFELEDGDAWLVPVGYEHGLSGPSSGDFSITVVWGSMPPGTHEPGHHYMEDEGYIPRFTLTKTPTTRYAGSSSSRDGE